MVLEKFYYELVGGVAPELSHDTDTGYDITLIEKIKTIRMTCIGPVSLYDSGLIVSPPEGYYFDLVARSSLSKTGHLLANGFGVIDAAYRGHLMAAMLKYDSDVPDLELPGRYVQLIIRPLIHFIPTEVSDISKTDRGSKGFGSTGK
jgi:dUTP pyrophosphatase